MSEFVLPNFPTDVLQGIGTTDMQYICILKTGDVILYSYAPDAVAVSPLFISHIFFSNRGGEEVQLLI